MDKNIRQEHTNRDAPHHHHIDGHVPLSLEHDKKNVHVLLHTQALPFQVCSQLLDRVAGIMLNIILERVLRRFMKTVAKSRSSKPLLPRQGVAG
jgi:hypothetical protein